MALRIRPLPNRVQPSATILLPPSPCVPGGTGKFRYKQELLKELLAWMTSRFKPGVMYGEFELAKAMNLHRAIVNEWLSGLVDSGLIESHVVKYPLLDLQGLAFSISKERHKEYKRQSELGWNDLLLYDPWEDRSLDDIVYEARSPQMFCDKFYYSNHHEYYLIKKQQRIRPNQHMFVPGYVEEHEGWTDRSKDVPPLSVRALLDERISGIKTKQRPTP